VEEKTRPLSRRRFLGHSIAAAALAGSARAGGRIRGANDRIRVGFIGVGNRGTQLLHIFQSFEDVDVVALCDVYEPFLYRDRSRVDRELLAELGGRVPEMGESFAKSVGRYRDFRRLLDRDDVDAVVISTPDHWHAVQTVLACEGGKDVFVEKPLTIAIGEGKAMVAAAERTGRVVQVGLQRRSSPMYKRLSEQVRAGRIGKVTVARAYRVSNMYPGGIGRKLTKDPPDSLDWDLWLGPRAWRPYQDNIHPYRFRWWGEYSSQVANWGVHYFDLIRWMMGEEAPKYVSAHGGKYAVDDDRTIPDTMEVVFEFASGGLLVFGQYEAGGGSILGRADVELTGTLGTLSAGDGLGFRITPSAGGQFQSNDPRTEAEESLFDWRDETEAHVRDFLDCVKTRRPCNSTLEEGNRSTIFAHLANIAMETGARIEWDPVRERIVSPADANRLLEYEYRKPWRLT
jgi:predicted dehydrogenase